ncbi:MAG: tetratricopeptide repeat protein [Planctomycetales bacterium]|nr:tetratricopeptide repeat protein [Planctomycetales bacterium]
MAALSQTRSGRLNRQIRYFTWIFAAFLLVGGNRLFSQERTGNSASSNRQAIAFYSDAASFQNNGAFKLAIEEWEKLLNKYPNDPLASKAWHYLGICQVEQKDYARAITAFQEALKDQSLELREEALFNLSWSQFTFARLQPTGSRQQLAGLAEAKTSLRSLLQQFGEGPFRDEALFYLGEIEYSLGEKRAAIANYEKLLGDKNLANSNLRPDARYALAVAYEEQKQLALARKQYEQFLQEHPDHRLKNEVRVRLGDILIADRKLNEAFELLNRSLTESDEPTVSDYSLLRLGYVLTQQGNPKQAQNYYERLLQSHPNSPHAAAATMSLGQLLYQEGNYEQSIATFKKLLESKGEQAAEAAHRISITLLKLNKPQEVLDLLETVLPWSGETAIAPSIQMDYADALYAIPSQLERAQKAYEQIVTQTPDSPLAPRAAYNAAFAALQRGRLAEARDWAEKFLDKYPQDPLRNDVAYIAAEVLLQQGEFQAAAKALDKLRKSAQGDASLPLWTLRQAKAHYLAGEYQPAQDVLQARSMRFEQDIQKAEAEFIIGASLLYQDKLTEAVSQLTNSHRTSDSWASADEVLLLLSEAQQRLKDNQAARQTLQRLLQKYPNTRLKSQVEYKLAQLSAALNEFDEAISQYEKIVEDPAADGLRRFALYGISWCLMQQERYQPALDSLVPLLAEQDNDSIASEALLAEGVCLRKLARPEQAVGSLSKFLQTTPTGNSLGNGLYELGMAQTELGQLDAATDTFERIIQDVPNYPALDKVLYELAWNYEENKNEEQSGKFFMELTSRFPTSDLAAEANYMLAQRNYDNQDYGQAIKTYETVLKQTDSPELIEKTLYKLGWSYFQDKRYPQAVEQFRKQSQQFPSGPLAVDGLFMQAECEFNEDRFEDALKGYVNARQTLESNRDTAASSQVRTLIYLHGAQCHRELKNWDQCEAWLKTIVEQPSESPYKPIALYEMGYCKQSQNQFDEALKFYGEVANNYRNESAARARFMMGEVYFSQRDFVKAIPEFQRVMYGFGGDKAPPEIKNWQAKSAYEAARCSEVLIKDLGGNAREQIIKTALDFYSFIVEKHAAHDLAAQAQNRLGELRKLR